jgi:coronin-1B/1C/6
MFTSIDWNYNGSLIAGIDRANAVRVFDPRAGDQVTMAKNAHSGAKPCYMCWLGDSPNILTSGAARLGWREFSLWDHRKMSDPVSANKIDQGALSFEPLYIEDNGVVLFAARGENTFHSFEIEDLTRATLKPDHCGENPLAVYKCASFVAPGAPTTAIALSPRRTLDTQATQVARVFRLSPTVLEPITFTVPRSSETKEFFSDDLYPDARSGQPALSLGQWKEGTDANPCLQGLNVQSLDLLSQRDPSKAHAAMKRAQANTARFQKERREEEERQRRQDDTFDRFRNLAAQHEEYNPNLSTGGNRGHDEARAAQKAKDQEDPNNDVDEDEWDD